MKHSFFLKLTAVALLTAFVATGCKKGPKNVTPIPAGRTSPTATAAETQPTRTGPGGANPALGGLTPGNTLPLTEPVRPDSIPQFPPPKPFVDGAAIPISDPGTYMDRPMDRTAFAANTVHFDYDKAVVKASEVSKLKPVAAALKASPQNMLLVEGHCDERGTEEYNRSLGERRALAIRTYLVKEGISPDRLHTKSYGEDQPAALGHDEAAWAKNRRGELVLLKPKI